MDVSAALTLGCSACMSLAMVVGAELELCWVEAIARVINPACVNGKVPPEGRQPCSTGDRNVIQGLACVL